MATAGTFSHLASPGVRAYAGGMPKDKGTAGIVSPDSQIMRFFDRSEYAPPLNPQSARPLVDQTLGDQFGSPQYELNIGMQIRNLIRLESEGPWFTIILPLRQTDTLTFTGTIWRYNRRLPTPTPYHGPSPYVTEEFEEFYGQLQRYGESIRMESDYFKTTPGQQNFFLKLTGIASDMVEGIRFDVMRALLRGIDEYKRRYMNHTYSENIEDDLMLRVALFACLQKVPLEDNKLGQVAEMLNRLLAEHVGQDAVLEMIVPPMWGVYMNKINQTPASVPYYLQGDDGAQLFIRNGPTPRGQLGRHRFWEYGDNILETGSRPMRTLQRAVSVLEYARMQFGYRGSGLYQMLTGLLANDKNVGRARNIFVYSATENTYSELKLSEMILGSNIVPASYKSGDPNSAPYRDLMRQYKRLGSDAVGRFFPHLKKDAPGQNNQTGQREAPSFLAWEEKGNTEDGSPFIRVKYAGEKDENVTAPMDLINAGEIACAHLTFSYGLANIGAHYANAFTIRRRIQNASDNVAYWRAFYAANIRASAVSAGGGNLVLRGSRLTSSMDYDMYRERWGQHEYDGVGELATQPEGHYIIPSKLTYPGFKSLQIPPGCDCATGIRSISSLSEDSGWSVALIEAVRDHENALTSMVEQAKKFSDSEMVNPLNRLPWEHNADMGALCTAYTNGISQFRAPIFIRTYQNLTDGTNPATVDTRAYDARVKPFLDNDPDRAAIAGTGGVQPRRKPRRVVDPVTNSLGDEEGDDLEMEEHEETDLQSLMREYFVNLQNDRDDIDVGFEQVPAIGLLPGTDTLPGFLYSVTTYFNKDASGTNFLNSYVRSVYIDFSVLNETNEDVVDAVFDLATAFVETARDMGTGNIETALLSIGRSTAQRIRLPAESAGTVGTRAGSPYASYSSFYFDAKTGMRVTGVVDDPNFTSTKEVDVDALANKFSSVVSDASYTAPTGPLGAQPGMAELGAFAPAEDESSLFVVTGDNTAGSYIRCALVFTPGMVKSRTYERAESPVAPGNKNTGYTTPISFIDRASITNFRRSGLVHNVQSITSGVRNVSTGYHEIDTGVPRHPSHFGFNQVHSRMAGMDDEGNFPTPSEREYAEEMHYYDDDDEDEEIAMSIASRSTGTGSVSLLGSRRRGGRRRRGRYSRKGKERYEQEFSESQIGAGAPRARSYYEGARRRGAPRRFGRAPFAHALEAPFRERYSEHHGFDAIDPGTGKLRKGLRMVQRFNGSNFVRNVEAVTEDPSSPCTFFALAFMMSRCDRIEDYQKLIKNRLHVDSNFLIFRIVELYTESAILLKAGLGFTAVNNSDYVNGLITGTKTYHGHLTVHFGAFVTLPDHEVMMEDMRMAGYIGGKGTGVVMGPKDLTQRGTRRGSGRPSCIVYSYPIATEKLPRLQSLNGRWELEDVRPENLPAHGALYPGVDWHERIWRWTETITSERADRRFFHKRGFTNPLIGFQGWQMIYNLNEGNFFVWSHGEGHLSGLDYVGAVNVMNGNDSHGRYPGDPIVA